MTKEAPQTAAWNRLAAVPRPVAALLLALLAGLMLLGLDRSAPPVNPNLRSAALPKAEGMIGDHALYLMILRKMEAGAPYYETVADVHRAHHYPLRPFPAVRLPTLETLLSIIGLPAGTILAALIGLAALIAWRRRLANDPDLPRYARFGVLAMAVNMGQLMSGQWVLIHEVVAGALIALALALYRPDRPRAAMAAIAAALAIRETVLPVAMLFGLFALIDRDWRAAGAWIAVGVAFAIGLALHAGAVAGVVRPDDLVGRSWASLGGWSNYIDFVYQTSGLRFVTPMWVTAILTPLALLGWLAWRSRLGLLGFGAQLVYAALFMTFARADNFYWGMLVIPTLFIGLIFAPAALAGLLRSLRAPSGYPPPSRVGADLAR